MYDIYIRGEAPIQLSVQLICTVKTYECFNLVRFTEEKCKVESNTTERSPFTACGPVEALGTVNQVCTYVSFFRILAKKGQKLFFIMNMSGRFLLMLVQISFKGLHPKRYQSGIRQTILTAWDLLLLTKELELCKTTVWFFCRRYVIWLLSNGEKRQESERILTCYNI